MTNLKEETYLWLGLSWKCNFWIDLWIKIPKIVHYGNTVLILE